MKVHKDLRDLAAAARQAGADVVEHGNHFVVRKDGQNITRLPAARGRTAVSAQQRRTTEKRLRAAGLLNGGGQIYAPHQHDLKLAHGTTDIIQAADRSRGRTHEQVDGSGLMPAEEVVGVLQAAVVQAGKGAKHRGGLVKVARDAVATARYRNLPPPSQRGDTTEPWDERRIAGVLQKFISSDGRATKRTLQFFRAHAEELTDRLDTFVDVTGRDQPPTRPAGVEAMVDKAARDIAAVHAAAIEEAKAVVPEPEKPDTPRYAYVDVVPLAREISLGSAMDLVETVREVGEADLTLDGISLRVEAADLWDLREKLLGLGVKVDKARVQVLP